MAQSGLDISQTMKENRGQIEVGSPGARQSAGLGLMHRQSTAGVTGSFELHYVPGVSAVLVGAGEQIGGADDRDRVVLLLHGACTYIGKDGPVRMAALDVAYLPAGAGEAVRTNEGETAQVLLLSRNGARAPGQKSCVSRRADVASIELGQELGFDRVHSSLLITTERVGARSLLFGFARFEPGGAHRLHRHRAAAEIVYVIDGDSCEHVTLHAPTGVAPGDLLSIGAGEWHGFRNLGDRDALIAFAYVGAGSPGDEGYELHAA